MLELSPFSLKFNYPKEMKMKCGIKKGEITLCKELNALFDRYDSKIEKVTMCYMNDTSTDFIGSVTFRYGRKKNEIVAISFCPFCGGELR